MVGPFAALLFAIALALTTITLPACDRLYIDADGQGPTLKNARVFLPTGGTPGYVYTPRVLASDGTYLWVIDRTARVQRINPETGACVQWFRMPDWELGKPTGMAIGVSPEGKGQRAIYVADTHYHRIMIYEFPGEPAPDQPAVAITPRLIASIGTYGNAPGQFVYPCAVAVLPTADGQSLERLYVGEFGGNDRIQTFDRELKFVKQIGSAGMGEDEKKLEFSRPQSIIIDVPSKRMFVADSINHRVGVLTLEGELVRWIGKPALTGRTPGQFSHPRGLSMLSDGTLLVVEFANNRVQRIDTKTGESLAVLGRTGMKIGELAEPWGIAEVGGRFFIAEGKANRVQVFDQMW